MFFTQEELKALAEGKIVRRLSSPDVAILISLTQEGNYRVQVFAPRIALNPFPFRKTVVRLRDAQDLFFSWVRAGICHVTNMSEATKMNKQLIHIC
jgi:hypothetical protein